VIAGELPGFDRSFAAAVEDLARLQQERFPVAGGRGR
jgi:hypothetical protein